MRDFLFTNFCDNEPILSSSDFFLFFSFLFFYILLPFSCKYPGKSVWWCRCKFYTWFGPENSLFARYCFLFSSCDKVTEGLGHDREHVKKPIAFLVEKSTKVLIPPRCLGNIFFYYIFMFSKPANSEIENGSQKNSKMFSENIHIQQKLETGKDTFWKDFSAKKHVFFYAPLYLMLLRAESCLT